MRGEMGRKSGGRAEEVTLAGAQIPPVVMKSG